MKINKNVPERRMSIKKDQEKKLNLKDIRQDSEPSTIHEQKMVEPKNLNEVITKTLSMRDPQFGKNQLYFSYPDKQYRVLEKEENFISILSLESAFINKDDKKLQQKEYYQRRSRNLITAPSKTKKRLME